MLAPESFLSSTQQHQASNTNNNRNVMMMPGNLYNNNTDNAGQQQQQPLVGVAAAAQASKRRKAVCPSSVMGKIIVTDLPSGEKISQWAGVECYLSFISGHGPCLVVRSSKHKK